MLRAADVMPAHRAANALTAQLDRGTNRVRQTSATVSLMNQAYPALIYDGRIACRR